MSNDDKELKKYAEKSTIHIGLCLSVVANILSLMHYKIPNAKNSDYIIGLLLREWLENIDAVQKLYATCRVMPAMSIIRTSFEIFIQLEYLLNAENEIVNKATAYSVYSQYKRGKQIEKLIKLHKKNHSPTKNLERVLLDVKKKYAEINLPMAGIYKKTLNGAKTNKFWFGWTEVYDKSKRTFKMLTEDIKFNETETLGDWHDLIYDYMSKQAHGYNAGDRLFVTETGKMFLKGFGNPAEGIIGLDCIRIMTMGIVRTIDKHYKPVIKEEDVLTHEFAEKLMRLETESRTIEHKIKVF
jgi:hypothetical protein